MSAKAARDDRLFEDALVRDSRHRLIRSLEKRSIVNSTITGHITIRVFRYLRQESPREPESVGRELERVE